MSPKPAIYNFLLGPTFGSGDSLSSFSTTELEVSAAVDDAPEKLLVFFQHEAVSASRRDQQEFIERLRNFVAGRFRDAADSG